jgi:DNA-binding response OmpR family regulator
MSALLPLRALQEAARRAASILHPEDRAVRVIVVGRDGVEIVNVVVPPSGTHPTPETRADPPAVVPGWSFTERSALFDGKEAAVGPSRVRLLKVLAEAEGPMTAKELAKATYGANGDEESARFHVRELRKELKAHFDFEGDPVPNDGGYRLALR